MAKTKSKPAKKPARKPAKKAPSRSSVSVAKLAETVLAKLEMLGADPKLQSEIQWCIGSYKYDKNPTGLLEKMAEALSVLKAEHAKKTKGITAKLISDTEKALTA